MWYNGVSFMAKNGVCMSDKEGLTFKIDYEGQIDLENAVNSLKSLARSYRKYVTTHYRDASQSPRLYIESIERGSIVMHLVAESIVATQVMGGTNIAVDFIKNLNEIVSFILGKRRTSPQTLDADDYRNIIDLVQPARENLSNSINITPSYHIENCENVYITNQSSSQLEKQSELALEDMHSKVFTKMTHVLFTWEQARFDSSKSSGNKGIVPVVDSTARKVMFQNVRPTLPPSFLPCLLLLLILLIVA